jgi:hypothetical protein
MRYRFKVQHRQFAPGALVPETWDAGIIGTMLSAHRIEPVDAPEPAKSVDAPPADKMLRPASVKRKGMAAGHIELD